jgi:two-component system chemotaxis response regulator CheY
MTERGIRVLVVEDELPTQQILAEILTDEGYDVAVASHGLQALDCVRHAMPDVVLLDLNMPVMDGWGFRKALREDVEGGERPRIILLTADYNSREKAERIGAEAFLTKPFDIDRLLATVSEVA